MTASREASFGAREPEARFSTSCYGAVVGPGQRACRRACVGVVSLVLGALALSAAPRALAQPVAPPVRVEVDGLFGDEALVGTGYAPVVVRATNTTATAFRGHLTIETREWRASTERYEVALDLPPGESRQSIVTVFARDSAEIEARYEDEGGRILGLGSQVVSYGAGARPVVLVEDPAIHRANLLDLQLETVDSTGAYGYMGSSPRLVNVPVGVATSDARTGDPLLPESPLGYATVGLLVVTVPMAARMSELQMQAIERWVHTGGRVLLLPRTEADLRSPLVTRFITGATSSTTPARSALAPAAAMRLTCPEGTDEDGGGCGRPVGFGDVWVAPVAVAATSDGADGIAFRELVHAILDHDRVGHAALPLGVGDDRVEEGYSYGATPAAGSIADLRASLDPNEGYRASLVLIAVLLFLYVIFVGPVNFRIVERRNQPTLALVTTPLLALACAAALLFVGYVGKGVTMRYRRLELLELNEGSTIATARRYTGWFFTRPASLEVEGRERGGIRETLGDGIGPLVRIGATTSTLTDLRAGLWETPVTREDHTVTLEGTIRFELDGTRLATVVNETGFALRGVVVIDNVGAAYAVGDVPAGGRAPIPTSTGVFVTEPTSYYGSVDTSLTAMRQAFSLTADDEPLARGVSDLLGNELVGTILPTLYAWAEPDAEPSSSPGFSNEWDRRLLRVVPDYPGGALASTLPPPLAPPSDDIEPYLLPGGAP